MKKAFPWLRNKDDPKSEGKLITSGRMVVIREKREEDAPDDYAWRTDEELARLDATRPITMSYPEFFRFSRDEMQYANRSSKRLAIDTQDGRHIGNCMYYDINARRGQAELGIMIGDRDYWGKGYGTDSVSALLAHIFTTTSLIRVYLHTLDWNQRARRSFAKAGFREVGNVHRGGMDFVLMEILKPEWARRQPPSHNGAAPNMHSDGEQSDDGATRANQPG